MRPFPTLSALLLIAVGLCACSDAGPWNSPYSPESDGKMVYHSVISPAPPKHLDPALSNASDESLFLMQIYEPPLGYHFLKRPYVLEPLALARMPDIIYLDADGNMLDNTDELPAFTRYLLHIDPEQRYQPHPAFAKDDDGNPLYLFATAAAGEQYQQIPDFPQTGSRTVTAGDFAYGIKRLADPLLSSPMLGFFKRYIVGWEAFSKTLGEIERSGWLNLHDFDMEGLKVIDDHTLAITIKGRYPQFSYWMAMTFFAPIAPEVDRFYSNPGFAERNLTLDWWPVGAGPYMMVKNDPNSAIVLERNPNYHPAYYPAEGEMSDEKNGWLTDAGQRIPFVDKAVYTLEKEVLPLWTKFIQGYYDRSGEVHSNTNGVFDQAFVVGPEGLELAEDIADHGITMSEDVKPSTYYYGFNMRDPVVGGYTEDKRKLRRALQIAFNTEEFLNIFYKGNGITGQSLLPPGIPGFKTGKAGLNPYVFDWVDGEYRRKSLDEARQLLAEAGYPGGRSAETGEPLRIYMDVQSQAITNPKMNWIVRTLGELGVQVEFRPADWNRTREKLLTGNTQIYSFGWIADYPDPENFLFLLYGPESPLVCKCDGNNQSNYENPEYDALFKKMRTLLPGAEKDTLVAQMVELFRRDAVWLYNYFPKQVYLNNLWVKNTKRHGISKATLKYIKVDSALRKEKRDAWNVPVIWPMAVALVVVIGLLAPGVIAYRKRLRATAKEEPTRG